MLLTQPSGRHVYTGDGPIEGNGDGSTTTGAITEVGRLHTNAMIDLENTIDRPIVLERVRVSPAPEDGRLDIIDVLVAVDEDRGAGGATYGFPPSDRGRLVPIEGAVIPPGPGTSFNLVMGVRLTAPGVGHSTMPTSCAPRRPPSNRTAATEPLLGRLRPGRRRLRNGAPHQESSR